MFNATIRCYILLTHWIGPQSRANSTFHRNMLLIKCTFVLAVVVTVTLIGVLVMLKSQLTTTTTTYGLTDSQQSNVNACEHLFAAHFQLTEIDFNVFVLLWLLFIIFSLSFAICRRRAPGSVCRRRTRTHSCAFCRPGPWKSFRKWSARCGYVNSIIAAPPCHSERVARVRACANNRHQRPAGDQSVCKVTGWPLESLWRAHARGDLHHATARRTSFRARASR